MIGPATMPAAVLSLCVSLTALGVLIWSVFTASAPECAQRVVYLEHPASFEERWPGWRTR